MPWWEDFDKAERAAAKRRHPAGRERDIPDSAAENPAGDAPVYRPVNPAPTKPLCGSGCNCGTTQSAARAVEERRDPWRVGTLDAALRGALSGFLKRIGGDR